MKRFHVHLPVDDPAQRIGLYSKLFAAAPARHEADHAKWMLTDPPVNFALSTRGHASGIDHLGIQTDNAEELAELKARAQAADMALLDEGATRCCYAHSEKHWVTDPQGVAWEHFHTLGNIPVFSETAPAQHADAASACRASSAGSASSAASAALPSRGKPLNIAVTAAPTNTSCC